MQENVCCVLCSRIYAYDKMYVKIANLKRSQRFPYLQYYDLPSSADSTASPLADFLRAVVPPKRAYSSQDRRPLRSFLTFSFGDFLRSLASLLSNHAEGTAMGEPPHSSTYELGRPSFASSMIIWKKS